MKRQKMKCGCWAVPENAVDASNFKGMSCKNHVQKNFPWFMQFDPDRADRKNWSENDAGVWFFQPVSRGPGQWAWKMPDFEAGENSPVPVWASD